MEISQSLIQMRKLHLRFGAKGLLKKILSRYTRAPQFAACFKFYRANISDRGNKAD